MLEFFFYLLHNRLLFVRITPNVDFNKRESRLGCQKPDYQPKHFQLHCLRLT